MATMMSQSKFLNGAALIILAFITSVFCQSTDHQMLVENCNWGSTNWVTYGAWSKFSLTSPSLANHTLASNLVCKTRFYTLSSSYFLKLRVRRFNLKGPSDCSSDWERVILQIDGYKNITWCGSTYPEEISLPTGAFNFIYNTGRFGQGTGFEIEISAVSDYSCYDQRNVFVTSQPMLLYSPNYPGLYGSSLSCNVTLNARYDQYIHIQSLSMDIENSASCQFDALMINNEKYCGQKPIDVVVKSHVVKILFTTDRTKTSSGFVLKYVALPVVTLPCTPPYAQNLTVNVTTVETIVVLEKNMAHVPMSYETVIQCQVTLDAGSYYRTIDVTLPQDLRGILNYKLTFPGETNLYGSNTVVIANSSGPRPYQTNGPTTLNYLRSPGRQVVVSADLQGNSFTFKVQAVDRDTLPLTVTARHSLLYVSSRLASTPQIFVMPENSEEEGVEVGVFDSTQSYGAMDNEADRLAVADKLTVYNGEDISYFELTKTCSNNVIYDKAIYSINSQNITVAFKRYLPSSGFWLYFGPSSGSYLPKPEELSKYKYFSSNVYNMKNLYCAWTLSESTQAEMIRKSWLIKLSAETNLNPNVLGNSFTVANESTVLMKYTKQIQKNILLYSESPINITVSLFNAESNNQPVYFSFYYTILETWNDIEPVDCQPTQLQASVIVKYASTPNYPNLYKNTNCEWTVMKSSFYNQEAIAIDIADMSQFSCFGYEVHILARNIGEDFYLINNLYSRDSFNGSFEQDEVKVQIVRGSCYDSSLNTKYMQPGFHFAYYVQALKKEFTLYASSYSDYITSPNYPNSYPSLVDYTWYIKTASYQSVIMVELVDFSLENNYQLECSNDYVKVYDGSSIYSRQIKVFCGKIFYAKFNSTGSDMTIVFHSDRQITDAGFKFKYSAQRKPSDSGDCSGCHSDYMGVIIGIITGGISCILIVSGVIICLLRRRKRMRASTSNRVTGPNARLGVPVASGNNSMFIMSPPSMAPPPYLTLQGTDPPPYSSLNVLPTYSPRFNDYGNTGYTVNDLPPPYSTDLPGGTAQQVPGVIPSYSTQGSLPDNANNRAPLLTTSGAGVDITTGGNFGNRGGVGDDIFPTRDHVMNTASAPSLETHLNHVGNNVPPESPPAYDNGSFIDDSGQQRILPQKKNNVLGPL